jgi:predicted transcriptional regulator
MATQNPTDAEIFQQFLAVQVATTGRTMSPEQLVRLWRERQQEQTETLKSLEQGIADIEAGRVQPFDQVNDEIRRKHGWTSAQ